jgi:hypothetical protein
MPYRTTVEDLPKLSGRRPPGRSRYGFEQPLGALMASAIEGVRAVRGSWNR